MALWEVLSKYCISGILLEAVKGFYGNIRVCVKVMEVRGEMLGVKMGLRQRCVMSSWLFTLFIDSEVMVLKMECEWEGLNMETTSGGNMEGKNVAIDGENEG